jgi:hypothetical protein
VLFAYNQAKPLESTAVLGMVTESLTMNDKEPELGYMAALTVEPIYVCLEHHGMLPTCQDLNRPVQNSLSVGPYHEITAVVSSCACRAHNRN